MKTLPLLLAAATLATVAQAAPFAKADAKAGKALHDKLCTRCHIDMFGGDGSGIYTRADRKIRNAQQLAVRIAGCNVNTGAGLFPEDEANIGAYLNQKFYKFN